MTGGLSHLTYIVRDLGRMERLLVVLFEARKVYDSGEAGFSLAPERFYLIGDLWIAIMQGEPTARSYNHTAFKIEDSAYEAYHMRLLALGVEIKEGRPRVAGEGRSLYFYDYDNHLFELHTGTLEERLARYRA